MRCRSLRRVLGASAAFALATTMFTALAFGSEYKVLYRFAGGAGDGGEPRAGLIFDGAGNLYGTTVRGGPNDHGSVFKLSPNPDGTWTESVIYFFQGGTDGSFPEARLVFDAGGNLYGTTVHDGDPTSYQGCGTVFKLSPNPDGTWTESVIHRFNDQDGNSPYGRVIFDPAGNLYGTTYFGGQTHSGTVFKLAPNPDGTWTETVLHSFLGKDGAEPMAGLAFDSSGNLLGTTGYGGKFLAGTVFELLPNPDGSWTKKTIHPFHHTDGGGPSTDLTMDTAGNFYGTTFAGGKYEKGVVFRLKPRGDGTWKERVIHAFQGSPGYYPDAGVVFDKAGNLYGTTFFGGDQACRDGCGSVFKLMPMPDGTWKIDILYKFQGHSGTGQAPDGTLVLDAADNVYGTTARGGKGNGVVFQITP